MVDRVRLAARQSSAYIAFRRWQREGFLRALRRNVLWRRILATPPVRTASRKANAIEIHTLCYRLDHLTAIWALKTFYKTSDVDFSLVIHVSGSPESAIYDRLRTHFPDATIIPQDEADRLVEKRLAEGDLTRLAAVRRKSPFMLKLTDFHILANGAPVLGIDSDVLFFSKPEELLDSIQRPKRGYLFQRDPESTYNITSETAQRQFGITLIPRINTGLLAYLPQASDLAAFERYLADPGVAVPNGFIEQTLYALHASELGEAEFLPDTYSLDLRAGLSYEGVIARHYAGPSRPLLTNEGMPRVIDSGILAGRQK